MLKKYNLMFVPMSFFVALITVTFFGTSVAYAGGNVINMVEHYIESANLLLITIALIMSFSMSSRMGGVIKEAANAIILVLVFFWVKEFVSVLVLFDFISLEGATDVIEFLMILVLLRVMLKLRKLL